MKKICSFILVAILAVAYTQTAYAAPNTTLSITSASSNYALQATFYSDVVINTGSNTVVSADIILNFNPAVLEAVDAQTGSFLPSSSIVTEQLDNTNGKVTISLFTHKEQARQGTGTLARVQWRAKNTGSTTVSFDSTKTLVYGLQEGNVLQSTGAKEFTVSTSGSTGTNNPVHQPPKATVTTPHSAPVNPGTGGSKGIVTYGQSSGQNAAGSETPETSSTGTILPSNSELDTSIVGKFVATVQDIFTPRGDETAASDPQQTPVFKAQNTNSLFSPIIFVWILGFLLLCGGGVIIYLKKFRKAKTGSNLQEVAPDQNHENIGS